METKIISINTTIPPKRFSQDEIYELLGYQEKKFERIFQNCEVAHRYLYIPSDGFRFNETVEQLNERRIEGALSLGKRAVSSCLEKSTVLRNDIGIILFISSTCFLHPQIAYSILSQMHFGENVQLLNILGMSCTGALMGLHRAHEFLQTNKNTTALVLCVELCSTAYTIDDTYETVVGNAIGADGAVACLLSNKEHVKGPSIVSFKSLIFPKYERLMSFDLIKGRLRVRLSKDVVDVAGEITEKAISQLLSENNLKPNDIKYWLFHPGGKKIMDNIQITLNLSNVDMKYSRKVLRNYGNISSATVFFTFAELVKHEKPRPGDYGILAAVGPGMVAESCLIQW